MAIGDKMKKGLGGVTRVGSDDLDKRRQSEKISDHSKEIDDIKRDMGNTIFVSYVRGEPVDERFVSSCERISVLVGKMNEIDSRQKSGNYSLSDDDSSNQGKAGFK